MVNFSILVTTSSKYVKYSFHNSINANSGFIFNNLNNNDYILILINIKGKGTSALINT